MKLKFTYKKSKTSVNFLDVVVRINSDKSETDSYSKPTDGHQFLECNVAILYTSKNQWFIVKGYVLKDYICRNWHLKNTLRVYVLGLGSVVTSRNLLTINLGTGVPLVVTFHP